MINTWSKKDIKKLEQEIEKYKNETVIMSRLELEFKNALSVVYDDIDKAIDSLSRAGDVYDGFSGFFRKLWHGCYHVSMSELIECANSKQILAKLNKQLLKHLNDAVFIILHGYAIDNLFAALDLLDEEEKDFDFLTVDEKNILLSMKEQSEKQGWWTFRISLAFRHVFDAYVAISTLYELSKRDKWFSKLHLALADTQGYLEEALRDFYPLYKYSRALEELERQKSKTE